MAAWTQIPGIMCEPPKWPIYYTRKHTHITVLTERINVSGARKYLHVTFSTDAKRFSTQAHKQFDEDWLPTRTTRPVIALKNAQPSPPSKKLTSSEISQFLRLGPNVVGRRDTIRHIGPECIIRNTYAHVLHIWCSGSLRIHLSSTVSPSTERSLIAFEWLGSNDKHPAKPHVFVCRFYGFRIRRSTLPQTTHMHTHVWYIRATMTSQPKMMAVWIS